MRQERAPAPAHRAQHVTPSLVTPSEAAVPAHRAQHDTPSRVTPSEEAAVPDARRKRGRRRRGKADRRATAKTGDVNEPQTFDVNNPPPTVAKFINLMLQPRSGANLQKVQTPLLSLGAIPNKMRDRRAKRRARQTRQKSRFKPKDLPATVDSEPPSVEPATADPALTKPALTKNVKAAPRRSRRRLPYAPDVHRPPRPLNIIPNEVLATNVDNGTLIKAIKMGFQVVTADHFSGLGMTVTRLRAPSSLTALDAHRTLQSMLQVGAVGFNHRYRLYRSATSERAATGRAHKACHRQGCYGQSAIGWSSTLARCAKDIKIGVIDTGIDAKHPAFTNRQIEFATTTSNGQRTSDDGHGTGILALLAGNPKSGVHGLIPEARFVLADIFSTDTGGEPVTDTVSLLRALELMGTLDDVAILNMSLSGPHDPPIKTAIAKLAKKGIILIAAAGNGGPGAPPSYPANYEQVISVTAVSQSENVFRHANHGDYIDLAAPGVRIWTALPGGQYGFQTGTSFAVPYVTAAAAAIYNTLPRHARTKATLLARLPTQDLGVPNRDKVYGKGLLLAPPNCSRNIVSWAPSVRRDAPVKPTSFSQLASQ